MIPIVTPAEMRAIDAAAPESIDVLVGRAAWAVARAAKDMLGGVYGRRVVVLAGKGLNGEDGRIAARQLARWGVKVTVIDAANPPAELADADLVIDAAYGTGLTRTYEPPDVGSTRVLAVDIPSGVNGLTGEIPGSAWVAERTVTFAALKPGLLLEPGASTTGQIEIVDIGLDLGDIRAHLVEPDDIARWLPQRPVTAHKWQSACWLIAGSEGMTGAAGLAAAGAARGGAGYVRLSSPGASLDSFEAPQEVVRYRLPTTGWAQELSDMDRFGSLVIGPGLGRSDATRTDVVHALRTADVPAVVDADAIAAVAEDPSVLRDRSRPTVLTPHDGEFRLLTGRAPGPDRLNEARVLAATLRCTVLLKGSATVVADPDGRVLVANRGDARLATAGTGDVLAGIIGALLAQGVAPLEAAAAGAWIHGDAGMRSPQQGMIASDLVTAIPAALDALGVN